MGGRADKLFWLQGLFVAYALALAGLQILLDPAGWTEPGWGIGLFLFILLMWLFGRLRRRESWARLVLLLLGWLAVLDGGFGLLLAPRPAGVGFGAIQPASGREWLWLLLAELGSSLLNLAYWGWLIIRLQFDPALRREFRLPPAPAGSPPG